MNVSGDLLDTLGAFKILRIVGGKKLFLLSEDCERKQIKKFKIIFCYKSFSCYYDNNIGKGNLPSPTPLLRLCLHICVKMHCLTIDPTKSQKFHRFVNTSKLLKVFFISLLVFGWFIQGLCFPNWRIDFNETKT